MSAVRRSLMNAKSGSKEQPNYLCFTALEDGTFTFTIASGIATSQLSYAEYSIDGGSNWIRTDNVNSTAITITTPTIHVGERVLWRASGDRTGNGSSSMSNFSSTGNFDLSGNIMSLLYVDDFSDNSEFSGGRNTQVFYGLFKDCVKLKDAHALLLPATILKMGCYLHLFEGCTGLVDASFNLPADLVYGVHAGDGAYQYMFAGCSSLIYPPTIEATSTSSYGLINMFQNCTSLVNAPQLHLTEIPDFGCASMFEGCTSLKSVSKIPIVSVSTYGCRYMFQNCTSLKSVPKDMLPATTLANYCYEHMFNGCSSLVEAPSLPATIIYPGCYNQMFTNCTSLIIAPELNAEQPDGESYKEMFRSTSINYLKCLMIPSFTATRWMTSVPDVSTSIFVKHIDAQWTTTGVAGVPTNWTIIYYDPALDKYYTDQTRATECDDHGNPI